MLEKLGGKAQVLREGSLEGEGVRRLRRGEKKAGKEKKRNIERMIREWGKAGGEEG